MSRYVLLPGQSKNSFVLVSTEKLNQVHTVELPEELYDMNIFKKVKTGTLLITCYIGSVKVKSQKQWMGLLRMEVVKRI